ncbi:MAG: hypothetical protein NTV51_03435 [Verrucomicrobia bacterium]|nr:hypothetical protein [Verrucomicrobiota bacterium]
MTLKPHLVGLAVFGAAGCIGPTARQKTEMRHFDEIRRAAATLTVDLTDGVSEAEAYRIAADHPAGRLFISFGGGLFPPKDEGSAWRVSWRAGIVGQMRTDLVIQKADGTVTVERNFPPPAPGPKAPPSAGARSPGGARSDPKVS